MAVSVTLWSKRMKCLQCLLYLEMCFFFFFYNRIVPSGFLPWEIRVAFPGESQLRQNGVKQPTVHAGCFSICIIHRTLTCTTGSLTCAQMFMHRIAHEGCSDTVRESALKVDSGRKIPCRTEQSNLPQRRAGPALYQLSYTPVPMAISASFRPW